MKTIAQEMKWENVGPFVEQQKTLISEQVSIDTRKLVSTEAFNAATSLEKPEEGATSLRAFLEGRSEFLLNHEAIKSL